MYTIPTLPLSVDLETKAVMRQLSLANRKLAELKGIALTIPNENILINTLVLQEAKDSSAVENIVTSHDELYRAESDLKHLAISTSTKEVLNYAEAMKHGFNSVRKKGVLTNADIREIQRILEQNDAGFRRAPGTTLKNQHGKIVYTPPQDKNVIEHYMDNLQIYINDDSVCDIDPLIKMAVIHHQFESIHPFYDGNGRTGRIINVLYLVVKQLLDLPILYMSRYIISNKSDYYARLQAVRDKQEWEPWILFMLKGVEETAEHSISQVKAISSLMMNFKHMARPLLGRAYRHEMLNSLFSHPYTKIDFLKENIGITRLTAAKHLEVLVSNNLLKKVKIGRNNYYINTQLCDLLINSNQKIDIINNERIESIIK